jgi:3-methyladenine DNA glycosylase AlkD
MSNKAAQFMAALAQLATPARAKASAWFFKTGKGQYGEGDMFIGVSVPDTRLVCKKFASLSLGEIQKLLNSKVHEHRLAAVILLANQYKKADQPQRQAIYDFYLKNVLAGRVNNWDIVDSSASQIVGAHCADHPSNILIKLAQSDNLWQRRVAMVGSFYFLRLNDPKPLIQIAEILLNDPQNLIQKAVGWGLREMGKRLGHQVLTDFLDKHAPNMPRVMLSYATEHLTAEARQQYRQAKKT